MKSPRYLHCVCVCVCVCVRARARARARVRFIFQLNCLAAGFHEIVSDNCGILGLGVTLLYLLTFEWRGRQTSQASSYVWGKNTTLLLN